MKEYAIKTRFVFEGHFFIKAENKTQAKEYAEKHCGLVLNRGVHSTLPDDAVDWDFNLHPEKQIGKIRLIRETATDDYRQYAFAQN
jgi:hypothetical protein